MPVIIFFSCFVNFVGLCPSKSPKAGPLNSVVGVEDHPPVGRRLRRPWPSALQQIIKRLAHGWAWFSTVVCFKCWGPFGACFVSADLRSPGSPTNPPCLRQNRSTGQSRKELFCSFGLKKHLSSNCLVLKRNIKCFFSFLKTQKRLSSCNIIGRERRPELGTSETNGAPNSASRWGDFIEIARL